MSIRVGVIGLGSLGSMHFSNLLGIEGVKVLAVCDIRPERLSDKAKGTAFNIDSGKTTGADLSGIRKYADWQELVAQDDLDAVVIGTPTFLHAEMSIKALQAGKHVFTEKPMALRADDCNAMVDASRQAGKVLQVGHVLRFWPEYVEIKQAIDSGRHGKVLSASFDRLGGLPLWSWENWFLNSARSGCAALDLHIHDTDVVRWFFGVPRQVRSAGVEAADGGVSHIATFFDYDDIPLVVAEGGWLPGPHPFYMCASVEFEQGTLVYDSRRKPTLEFYNKVTNKVEPIEVSSRSGYLLEMEYFLHCVKTGQPNDRVPPEQTAQAVAMVDAEVESAKTRRPVAVKG